jgi:hypothetical protein
MAVSTKAGSAHGGMINRQFVVSRCSHEIYNTINTILCYPSNHCLTIRTPILCRECKIEDDIFEVAPNTNTDGQTHGEVILTNRFALINGKFKMM